MKVEIRDRSVRIGIEDKNQFPSTESTDLNPYLLSKNIKNLGQFLDKLKNFDKNLTEEIENDLNTKQYIEAQHYKLNKKVYCNKPTLEKMKIKYDKGNSHAHLSAAFGL
tara:strand:+ start:571 stop:897 length:327 start_codon:yes stop_codon:yes gene_type:complete